MPQKEAVDDPILGRTTWDDELDAWDFFVELSSGEKVRGSIGVIGNDVPFTSELYDESKWLSQWIGNNEPLLREHAAKHMHGLALSQHKPETGAPPSLEEFRAGLAFEGFDVEDGMATVLYDASRYFAGRSIHFSVDETHKFGQPGLL